MTDENSPLGLADAARKLGVNPLELVRRTVLIREAPSPWVFSEARIESLKVAEIPWFDAGSLAPTPLGRVRAALGALVLRGYHGERQAPIEQVVSGLSSGDQTLIRRVFSALTKEGLLASSGGNISILPGSVERVSAISSGTADTPGMRSSLME